MMHINLSGLTCYKINSTVIVWDVLRLFIIHNDSRLSKHKRRIHNQLMTGFKSIFFLDQYIM